MAGFCESSSSGPYLKCDGNRECLMVDVGAAIGRPGIRLASPKGEVARSAGGVSIHRKMDQNEGAEADERCSPLQ